MTKRYALKDDQWEQIKDLLPGQASTVGDFQRQQAIC